MRFKSYLPFFLFMIVFACKKKSSSPAETPIVNNAQPLAYDCNLHTYLIMTKNSGGTFDTSFLFNGLYTETTYTNNPWLPFTSTNYNGYVSDINNSFSGQVNSSPNFLKLINKSSWNIISSDFGNFQYNDSLSIFTIDGDSTIVPLTFDANIGIPIKIINPQRSSSIILSDQDGYVYPFIKMYTQISYPPLSHTIVDTIKAPELLSIPLNSTFILTIGGGLTSTQTINGHGSWIAKTTNYKYEIKRVN
ncbi:MAG: hypothetical protein HY062_04350 [Bacteroidetes bacterium]|nr:hypothetical protein [Bacteroidota bacterium]